MNDRLRFHDRLNWLAIDFKGSNPHCLSGLWFCSDYDPADTLCLRIGRSRITCGCRLQERTPDGGAVIRFIVSVKTRHGWKWLRFCRENRDGHSLVISRRLLRMTSPVSAAGLREAENEIRNQTTRLLAQAVPATGPLVSVLMPVFNPPANCLEQAVASMRAQTYRHWELCLADDASSDPSIGPLLVKLAASDPRIKVFSRPINGHISAATNSALTLATGEWCALLDQDDELSPHALAAFVVALKSRPGTDMVYTDEDKLDETGRRHGVYHKPAWMPELLLGQNFISHLGFYRTDRLRLIGGFREGFEGCQDWDMTLRYTHGLPADRILHLPYALYHWRALPHSTAHSLAAKPYITAAAERTVKAALETRGIAARLAPLTAGQFRVEPVAISRPGVAVLGLLSADEESRIRSLTDYEPLTFLPRVAPSATELESLLAAARSTQAEILVILAGNMTPRQNSWLQRLVGALSIHGVVAAGGSLVAMNGVISDGCLMLDPQDRPVPAFQNHIETETGYFGRAQLLHNPGGLSLSAIAVRRDALLDLKPFQIPRFRDLQTQGWALCEQLRAAGGRLVYDPGVIIDHEPDPIQQPTGTARRFRKAADPSIAVRIHSLWPPL
jgi:O-antigen biosynthesis protein